MPHPVRHRENVLRLEKTACRSFPKFLLGHLGLLIGKQLEFRQAMVSILLGGLERDGALPFMRAHHQQLLRRERHERDVFKEIDICIAAHRSRFRHLWQFSVQPIMK